MEKKVPKLLFKFRALTTKTDLIRLVDILKEHRLFFPTRKDINDPFELGRTPIYCGGYAGSWYYSQYEREEPMISEKRDSYHFLSLSSDCFSSQLWAYYADTYTGVCLCYSTEKSFRTARPVEYSSECPDPLFDDNECDFDERMEKIIEEDIFFKQKEWEHEKEWRIVEKDGGKYFNYGAEELLGILIGHKMDDETKNFLLKSIPQTVKVLLTRPEMFQNRLAVLEHGIGISEIEGAGGLLQMIDTTEALYEYLSTDSAKVNIGDEMP